MPVGSNKRLKSVLIRVTAILALLIIPVVHHYQLKSRVERYQAELKAKGAWMDLSQLRPQSPPADQDGTAIFLKAISLVTNRSAVNDNPLIAMQMVAPGKAMVGAAQPMIYSYDGATNSWEDVQAVVDPNKQAVELLAQMIERPRVDFHIRYEDLFNDPTSFSDAHLSEIKSSVRLLTISAMIDLHHGDVSAAVSKTRAALSVVAATEDERLVISELVRIAAVSFAYNATWEILQSDKVSASDLATLQNDWQRLEFLRGYQQALAMEHECSALTLEQWRHSDAVFRKSPDMENAARKTLAGDESDIGGPWLKQAKLSGQLFMWRYWWSYTDELRALKGSEVLRKAALQAETNGALGVAFKQQQAQLDALGISLVNDVEVLANFFPDTDFHSMLSQSVSTIGNCLDRAMLAEAWKRETITAIALKRFQLEHGKYPAALNELEPAFLNCAPLDPVDGKPLRYCLNPDGTFLLYSLGKDGVDDGGNPQAPDKVTSFSWQQGRDWVWPWPATQEEIQAWEKRQSKNK